MVAEYVFGASGWSLVSVDQLAHVPKTCRAKTRRGRHDRVPDRIWWVLNGCTRSGPFPSLAMDFGSILIYLTRLRLTVARSVSFEVALFQMLGDKSFENQGNYYSPKRERGIIGFAAEKPKRNPSLTFRAASSEKAQLQKA